MKNKKQRVLIVKLSSIGDVVHTLPALYSLRKGLEAKGGVEIDWLVEEAASAVLKDNPLIDNLIIVKNRGWTGDTGVNVRTARFLASRRYDMVLDFQGLFKSGVWVALSKGVRRIGFSNSRELSPLFLNEKLPAYDPDKHAVDRYLDLARYAGGAGGAGGEAVFRLNITDGELARTMDVICGLGIGRGEKFFIMVPGARWATKLWDDAKFIQLGHRVVERHKLKVLITGALKDKGTVERIRSGIGEGAYNLAGLVDLKGLAALMKMAEFAVTVDSGPMHIAAGAGTPVVALFGPTAPWRTGPYGKGHRVVRRDLECSPCFKRSCKDPRCMNGITVETVMEAVEGILRQRSAQPGCPAGGPSEV